MVVLHPCLLLPFLFISLDFGCCSSAMITSSHLRYTFCPGENVTLTCSLSSPQHVWEVSGSASQFGISRGIPDTADPDGNIVFAVTDLDVENVTTSTMVFTVSVNDNLIRNGTWIACSSAGRGVQGRITLNQTVSIFGVVSPPQTPTPVRDVGSFTRLVLTFGPPIYGHECVKGYTVRVPDSPEREVNNNTASSIDIRGLNLCNSTYNLSLFACTASGNGIEESIITPVPDFSDLGRVSNISVVDGRLHWKAPHNASEDCVSGYTIQWPEGNVFIPKRSILVSGSMNSAEVSILTRDQSGALPLCMEVDTTIIPHVPIVASPLNVSQNDPVASVVYPDPSLQAPLIAVVDTDFDTLVRLQDLPQIAGVNVSVGMDNQVDQHCDTTTVSNTNSVFQGVVFPSECSDAGHALEFCVTFQYLQCSKSSIQSRLLPLANASGVDSTDITVNSIMLVIELRDITGDNCTSEDLGVVSALFQNRISVAMDPDRTYTPGRKEIFFSGLSSGTTYDFQVNITENMNILASYSGTVTTRTPFPVVAVAVPVVIAVLISLVIVIVVVGIVLRPKRPKPDCDMQELKESEQQKTYAEHVHHVQTTSGEEYAVVDKSNKNKPSQPDTQALYQDPNSIEHEKAPQTGDLYAVTEKKPKNVSKMVPTSDELAAMYSVPDKNKKNPGGLTYASLDMPGGGGGSDAGGGGGSEASKRPAPTEYATVIN